MYQPLRVPTNSPISQTKTLPPKEFHQILSSYRTPSPKKEYRESSGLRITDYLANPIPAKYYKKGAIACSPKKPNVGMAAKPNKRNEKTFKTHSLGGKLLNTSARGISVRLRIARSINKAAEKYGLPPELIKGVIQTESSFRVRAVSPAGAKGLMQLMPGTAKALGVTDPFNIDQNIDGGARYLRKMLGLFGGDVKVALAAYNAGPGAVRRYKGIPPYPETRLFLNRVFRYYGQMA